MVTSLYCRLSFKTIHNDQSGYKTERINWHYLHVQSASSSSLSHVTTHASITLQLDRTYILPLLGSVTAHHKLPKSNMLYVGYTSQSSNFSILSLIHTLTLSTLLICLTTQMGIVVGGLLEEQGRDSVVLVGTTVCWGAHTLACCYWYYWCQKSIDHCQYSSVLLTLIACPILILEWGALAVHGCTLASYGGLKVSHCVCSLLHILCRISGELVVNFLRLNHLHAQLWFDVKFVCTFHIMWTSCKIIYIDRAPELLQKFSIRRFKHLHVVVNCGIKKEWA